MPHIKAILFKFIVGWMWHWNNVQLKQDATEINTWCSDNHMAANTSKAKVILVTNWQKRLSLPADH